MHLTTYSSSPVLAARIEDLVITETQEEMLAYDMNHHHIHHLNPLSKEIWRLCDGTRSVTDIARDADPAVAGKVDDEVVRLALTKLAAADLLVGELDASLRVDRHSCRNEGDSGSPESPSFRSPHPAGPPSPTWPIAPSWPATWATARPAEPFSSPGGSCE